MRRATRFWPHDDSLDRRAIAFVIYLTPNWNAVSARCFPTLLYKRCVKLQTDGGELALYDADSHTRRPKSVVKRLPPTFNSLVIFPVATNTWHAVDEVLADGHKRLSLNGWFHADDARASLPPESAELPSRSLPIVGNVTVRLPQLTAVLFVLSAA